MKIYSFEAVKTSLLFEKNLVFMQITIVAIVKKVEGRVGNLKYFTPPRLRQIVTQWSKALGWWGSCIFDDSLARPLTLCEQQDKTF